MPNADILQKPKIIQIIGSTIRIAHPDVSGYTKTRLRSQVAAAGTTLTVADTNGFADNDWLIVGAVGDNVTESTDVNQANVAGTGLIARASTMTVTNTLTFAHELDAPVTRILERGIRIYGAATDGGTGTLIASIDALTATGRFLADAVMIQWDKSFTEYTMISTDTAYLFYYVVFTDGTTDSESSDYIVAAGLPFNSIERFIQQALKITNSKIGDKITREDCVQWADDCQDAIIQYNYQDPVTGFQVMVDWDFEMIEDITSLTTSTGVLQHALSGLTTAIKYTDTARGVLSVRIGTNKPLTKVDHNEYEEDMLGVANTLANGVAAVGATSITVDSNVEFADSGTLYSGANTITYTGKTGTTQFTGVPASGTGSIETEIADNNPIWQGISLDLPTEYMIFAASLFFNKPIDSDNNALPIKIKYIKRLTRLTEASDTTEVPFTSCFQYYIASRIMDRKEKPELAMKYMKQFHDIVYANALNQKSFLPDEFTYYKYNL